METAAVAPEAGVLYKFGAPGVDMDGTTDVGDICEAMLESGDYTLSAAGFLVAQTSGGDVVEVSEVAAGPAADATVPEGGPPA